jgi:MFS family permease
MAQERRAQAVAAGCAVSIAGGWNLANTGPVAETLAEAYSASLVTIGAFTTALFLCHASTQIPGGRLVDRVGPRRPALLSLALIFGANLVAMAAPVPALGLACRALAGVGTALTFVAGTDFVRRFGGTTFDQGLFGGVGLGAGGAALAAVPALAAVVGWRAPFLSASAIALLVLPFVLAGPRTPPAARGERPAGRPRVPRDRTLYRFGLMHGAGLGFAVVLGTWVVPLLTRHDVKPLWVAGLIGSLVLTVGAIGRPLGGWIARKAPARTRAMLMLSMVIGGGCTAIVALGPPAPVLVLSAALIGLCGGIPFGPALYGAGRAFPDSAGAAAGVVNTFAGTLILVGTPLMAVTFTLPGDGRLGFFVAAALWASVALLVPSSLTFRLPDPSRADR